MGFEITEITDSAGGRWVQWVDLAKAEGWARRLGVLAGTEPTGSLAEKIAATKDLWDALAAFYQSVDLPPQADPAYVAAWVAREAGSPYRGAGLWRREAMAALTRESEDARDALDAGDVFLVDVAKRISLSERATVSADLLGATDAPPTARGVDYRRSGCTEGQSTIWQCWIWSEWWPGALTAGDGLVVSLPPVQAFWRMGADVARSIADAGALPVVARARRWTTVHNTVAAREAGAELPEDLVTLAAEDAALHQSVDPDWEGLGEVGALIAGALAAATPAGAALVALATGIPAALQLAFGRAVGSTVDPFGRRNPHYQTTAISGSLAPRQPPTQIPPDPPREPWRVPYTGTLYLPPSVEVLGVVNESSDGDSGGLLLVGALFAAIALASR